MGPEIHGDIPREEIGQTQRDAGRIEPDHACRSIQPVEQYVGVAFRFNGQGGAVIAGVGFELYQNQPNPFVNKTLIGFPTCLRQREQRDGLRRNRPHAVHAPEGQFGKGYNAIAIDRALLNTTGVMYYKLETATDAATKKMIQTK